MKSLRLLALLLAGGLALAGCGDGSIKSPAFTPVLLELQLAAQADAGTTTDFTAAVGESAPLVVTAIFSTPPGSPEEEIAVPVNDAAFSLAPQGRAGIQNSVFKGTGTGVVTVTASKDGIESESITIQVTPPEVVAIFIQPASASVPAGSRQVFEATARFTDDEVRPTNVNWSLAAGASPTLSLEGDATDSSMIFVRASAIAAPGDAGTLVAASTVAPAVDDATASIAVTDATPIGIDPSSSVTCNPDTVGIGGQSTCSVRVRLSNGETADGSGSVTWSVAPGETRAAVVDAAAGTFSGVAAGTAVVRATFNGTAAAPGLGTVDGSLIVAASASAFCPSPMLMPQVAVAPPDRDGPCLLCDISSPERVIDDDAETAGSLDTALGLLGGSVTMYVNRVDPDFFFNASVTNPVEVGFVVAQPAGLLSLGLLSSLQLSTTSAPEVGVQVGARLPQPGLIPPLPLTVTALGLIGGQERALVTFVATQPYNGIALTFDTGVLGLLSSVSVLQACAIADSSQVLPPP